MKNWLKKMLTFVVVICMVVSNMSFVMAETGVGDSSNTGDGGEIVAMVNVIIEGNGGTFSDGNETVTNIGTDFPVGSTLTAEGRTITDPVYWDSARAFEGWEIYTWQTGIDSEGNTWEDWVALEGAALLTTTELMTYVFPTGIIMFRAAWAGDDADYISDVAFDPWGGHFTIAMENDTWETDWFGSGCYERGTIQEEMGLVSLSDPVKDGDTFEGWLMHFPETMEVDETLYTTAEVLAMPVPAENVVFWAKWASVSMDEYMGTGGESGTPENSVEVIIDGNGGVIGVDDTTANDIGGHFPIGSTMTEEGLVVTDPVYWNPTRAFEGWGIYTWQTIIDEEGNSWEELLPLNDAVLTTTEMLAYELPEETIVFRAKWAGDDADFSSNVDFDLRNGHSTITVENESWETDWFGSNCYERGTIQEEMGIVSMSDPVKDGDTFEGWLMHFPETMEVDETLYTTAEVLAMQVPAENVVFWAKWASVSMDEYLGGGSEEIPEGMVEIIIEGNGGEMDVDGTTAGDVSGWFPIGSTMTDEGLVVTDPVYWDPTRAFEGWEIYTWQTIIDEEGNSWEDLLPLDGAALLTTTEMLAYELPDETIVFRAKWAGDDADYGSNVFFDMLGGEVTLETSDGSGTTNGMEGFFFMNGTLQDLMGIVSMTDPVMEGANFEGWLVIWVLENGMTFEYDAEGNAVLLTTSEVLAMDIPADDVVFAAKWDIYSLDDYLDNGDSSGEGYVEIDAHDGKFIVDGEEYEIYANWIETGTTLADAGVELTDLTYWDGQRAFEGWQLYKWVEVTGEDGQVWYDLLPVEDAKLLTTEEILNYETPEEEIVFRAVWEGDDADYTSIVEVDGLDGIFSITVEEDTFEIGSWIGGELPENGKTIGENFGIDGLGDPVLEGDTFEGWLAFIIDENELLSLERDADGEVKFYTSEEIIKKVVPEDGIVFAAKWKSIDLSFYLDLESKIETDVEDLPVIDPEKPVEDVTVGVDAEKTEETLGQTAAGVVDTVVAGDEKEIEALKKVVTEEVIDVIVDALEKGADVKVTTSVQVKPLDEDAMEAPEVAADVAAIEKAASSTQTILQFLDLSVEIKAYVDGELEGTGNVSELDEAIVFTVAIPEEAAKVPAGFTRAYFVIYVHDGVTKQIPAKLNEDGTISFNAGEFSTYALAYEDTLITNPNYPATGDTAPVALYVSVMGAAVVGLVLAGLKKRTVR